MKEIARIHLAKVTYDVELSAKKALETYLKALESYSDDAEIIQDVEIRMTEILAERGVQKGGVIAEDDVAALKEQLGEPHEFGEGDIAIGPGFEEGTATDHARKLYRDTDHAVLGGVLGGIAAFFQMNPLWIRLLFIIIAFASFGTALLVYIVLWIAVPPAKTAADKLQMAGRPVTLGSIRALNENEVTKDTRGGVGSRDIMLKVLGGFSILAALGVLCFTILVGVAAGVRSGGFSLMGSHLSGFLIAAFWLCIVSGLLLVVLLSLIAAAFFAKRISRRVLVSGCIVIVLGLASFGTAIGLTQYALFQRDHSIVQNTHTYPVVVPDAAKSTNALHITGKGVIVKYEVTNDAPSAFLRVVDDTKAVPKTTMSVDGSVLHVTTNATENKDVCVSLWSCDFQKTLIIRGPALTAVTVDKDTRFIYQAKDQPDLKLHADMSSSTTITAGRIEHLTLDTAENANVTGSEATISHVNATVKANSQVELGTVASLTITDENSCPSQATAMVAVWNVSGENVTVNGMAKPVESATFACSTLSIRNKEEE